MADKIEPVAWRATWADDWTDFADHNSTPGVDDPEAWKSFKQPPMEITPLYSQQQLDALVARAERAEAEAAANRDRKSVV